MKFIYTLFIPTSYPSGTVTTFGGHLSVVTEVELNYSFSLTCFTWMMTLFSALTSKDKQVKPP